MTAVDPVDTAATRTCPWCAEQIKSAAIVCRFCGHRADEPPELDEPDEEEAFTPGWMRRYRQKSREESREERRAMSEGPRITVLVGYIAAILMPLIGFILGIALVTRPDPPVAKHGGRIIALSILFAIIILVVILSVRAWDNANTVASSY